MKLSIQVGYTSCGNGYNISLFVLSVSSKHFILKFALASWHFYDRVLESRVLYIYSLAIGKIGSSVFASSLLRVQLFMFLSEWLIQQADVVF